MSLKDLFTFALFAAATASFASAQTCGTNDVQRLCSPPQGSTFTLGSSFRLAIKQSFDRYDSTPFMQAAFRPLEGTDGYDIVSMRIHSA